MSRHHYGARWGAQHRPDRHDGCPRPEDDTGTDAAERLVGSQGADTLDGARGNDTLKGLGGDDLLVGGPTGPDFGPDGPSDFDDDDRIHAGAGDDTVDGGWGEDRIYGDAGNDSLEGGWGNDTIEGGDGNDLLLGGLVGLIAFDDENKLYGGAGNDTLIGLFGSDLLVGGDGDDELAGTGGTNTLVGGKGKDLFQFGHGAPLTPVALIGEDTIRDFEQGRDVMDVSNMNSRGSPEEDEAYRFIGTASFSGSGEAELRYEIRGGVTVVELDSTSDFFSADGVADGTIELEGKFMLKEGDFIL